MPPPVPSNPAESRKPWRRLRWWIVRIAAFLIAVCILVFLGGEIVFATSLPRRLVISAIQKQLGLRIAARSVSTGWLGHTTLNDVAVALPLAEHAFLNMPTLEVSHTPPLWLLLGGSISIHSITIEEPRLDVIQGGGGSWNLQEVAQLLTRAGGAKNASDDSGTQSGHSIPQLPTLHVSNATVAITDDRHRQATIDNLSLNGMADGPLVWKYQATIPDHLDIVGKVAPGGAWAHEIAVNVQHMEGWMSPWIRSWPASGHLNARWSGEIDDGQVTGRLELDDAGFGSSKIAGPIEISGGDGRVTIRPSSLLLTDSSLATIDARLDSGQILINGTDIETRQLSMSIAGGRVDIDGRLTLADGAANLHAKWRDLVLPSSVRQSGDLSLDYVPSLGQPRFKAVLDSTGAAGGVTWDGQINLDGAGDSWRTLVLTVTAPKLRVNNAGRQAVDLSGLLAELNCTSNQVLLSDLQLGESSPIAGQGGYTFATHTAWLYLDARNWPIPAAKSATLNLNLNVWGDPARIHLQQLYLRSGALGVYGDGECVYHQPKPVSAHLYFNESPPIAGSGYDAEGLGGSLHGGVELAGTLNPTHLSISGDADGVDVHLGPRPLGNLKFALQGEIRDGQVSLDSRDIQFLGGSWRVAGHWPVKSSLLRLDTLSVEHLSLPLALPGKGIAGQLDGNWSVDIRHFNRNGVFVQGSAKASNVVFGGDANQSNSVLAIDEIRAPGILVDEGSVYIKPITLLRKAAGVSGSVMAELSTTLAHPSEFDVLLDASAWPIQADNANGLCLLWAKGHLDVDAKARSALGHLDLRADGSWKSQPIVRLDAAFDVNRRLIAADKLQVQALGGSGAGHGAFDFDHPYDARAGFEWKDIDLSRLKPLWPGLSALAGKLNGSLEIRRATNAHPLEPLALILRVHPEGLRLGPVDVGDLQTFAYIGAHRFVLDDDPSRPSQVAIAGGTVQFWGRVSRHAGDVYQSLVELKLQSLDLDTVLPPGSKVARAPGLLSGTITVVGRPERPDLAFGEGHLTLAQSDLAGTGPIAMLYNLMHLGHNAKKPQGYGTMDFNLQHENISITSMRYFDRGAEVHAAGYISDVLRLSHSPINLVCVGSAQPLKSLDIPGLSDIGDALSVMQRGAASIRVTGELARPVSKAILFSDVSRDLEPILIFIGEGGQSGE